jgi:LysM repeat protein
MRRGRHEFRLTVWTFVAPIALVVAVLVVVNITQEVIDEGSTVQGTLRSAAARSAAATSGDTSQPGTTTAGNGQRPRFYTIRQGDTLSDIASRFDTTEEELRQLNPEVDPLALRPGQRISVR